MTTIVTINTDASYHPHYKVAGFGFWIVWQGQRTIQSGPLKDPISCHDCEIKCIANALYAVLKLDYLVVELVIVNTDSQSAIDCILQRGKKGEHYQEMQGVAKICRQYIKELRERYKPKKGKPFIEFRKVKAHSANDSKRNYVNNFLDRSAKEAMRKQIYGIKT